MRTTKDDLGGWGVEMMKGIEEIGRGGHMSMSCSTCSRGVVGCSSRVTRVATITTTLNASM